MATLSPCRAELLRSIGNLRHLRTSWHDVFSFIPNHVKIGPGELQIQWYLAEYYNLDGVSLSLKQKTFLFRLCQYKFC